MTIALAILLAPMAMAQEGMRKHKDPKAMAEARTERMAETLGLSEEQLARVKEINLRHAERMEALRAEQAEKRKDNMKRVRDEHHAELEKVLTPEQMQRLEEKRAERKAKGAERRTHEMKQRQQGKPEHAPERRGQ